MLLTSRTVRVVASLVIGVGLTFLSDVWLSGYGVFALMAWMLLVVTFLLAHAPEKTMAEIIRESR